MPDKKKTFPLNDDPKDRNEFINTEELEDHSPDSKSETDKAADTSDEDFESFDVDKVDDLEKSKNRDSDEKD